MEKKGKLKKYVPLLGSLLTLGLVLLRITYQVPEEEPELAVAAPVFTGFAAPHHRELLQTVPERPDLIKEAYGDEELRPEVIAFFGYLTGSVELARPVLENALRFNIPPALAFALSWEESRYNPRALNRANRDKTSDRGLFQLNSASFPRLSEAELFDPAINAYYGLSHLRWCLDTGGSEVAGLAMYNAGTGRVRGGGTPKNTLDYVSRIQESRRKIEDLFQNEYQRLAALRALESLPEDLAEPEESKAEPGLRLALLAPLGRRQGY
jgi:hypothetical protein